MELSGCLVQSGVWGGQGMSLVWAGVEEVVGAQGCEGGMVYRAMCSVGRMKTEGSRDMLPAS